MSHTISTTPFCRVFLLLSTILVSSCYNRPAALQDVSTDANSEISSTDTATSTVTDTETDTATTDPLDTSSEISSTDDTGDEAQADAPASTSAAAATATGSTTATATSSSTATTDPATSTASATQTSTSSSTSTAVTDTVPPAAPVACGSPDFTSTPTDIGQLLPDDFEPSGLDYLSATDELVAVSDEGTVALLTPDGSDLVMWSVSGDLEGVTVGGEDDGLIYLGDENPDAILEFDLELGRVIRRFDLTSWMQGAANQGLEALAFVPDDATSEGGYFYAGHQGEGRIYIFELPIQSSRSSQTVRYVGAFTPIVGRTNISSLDYDPSSGQLYAVYDGANKLVTLDENNEVIADVFLPQSDQEGFVMTDNCDVFIAQDSAPSIWRYQNP